MDFEAIVKAYPSICTLDDSFVNYGLDKDGNKVSIVQSNVDTARVTLDAEYQALDYARKRAAEYPSVVDQLDKMFLSGFQAWKDEIQKVKEKYPKP